MRRTSKSAWVIAALDLHERPLIRYARWLLGDLESARDVVQETFLRLCREDPARLGDHLAPWLFTVCRNLAADARKKAARLASLDETEIAVAADLDERHDARAALGQILHVLDTLPRNQREVVHLKFQGGLSYKEISAVTGLSVSNVGFLLHTAVRAIRSRVSAQPTGAGHEHASNQPERSAVDRLRLGRARG
ncbi:MAG TPA: sigma-70 family RNA polymerase sigma factor [Vicinamibacterales bacterium]|jgi:RNA polymerase sigma-70 factor (ECF subfamily)|nr:sigma-70 family RNA polymerase sigma factor [Vicinamibacterales bacterium]